MGLAPPETQDGGIACIFLGAPIPFILREEQDHFKLVGEWYVQGAMRGEVISSLEISDKTAEESRGSFGNSLCYN